MIVLTGNENDEHLRARVPEHALRRARQLQAENVGVVVMEEGDDVRRDFRMVGRYGLLTYLDDHYQAPFEYVRYVVEGGRRVFEALLAPSGRYLLVVPEEDWVDDRLLVVLDVEGEEIQAAGDDETKRPPKTILNPTPGPDEDRTPPVSLNNSLSGDGQSA